ncbi:hypothetical protein BTN49_2944 [Candidatus Enterovibrio escicola]|uniref:Uncharacterized protein n=1 Tax=Candidatus Enterovibrio escicola TaxID=1927127 RepID=A0A2A5SZS7_9GAMM|nr:hypothetical protein BTN49_2944 [Candidatus Enterovibrio escacola]
MVTGYEYSQIRSENMFKAKQFRFDNFEIHSCLLSVQAC